jgi:medium-chain acyl-[acyl-carrier-protein] hydrolase
VSSATSTYAPKIWEEDFKIHSYEIGASGYASPQSICKFLQEAASNHAAALDVSAEEMSENQRMWVLSQLGVRMKVYPRWHDTIHIRTWPVTRGSLVKGFRDFELRNGSGEIIGHASTMWLLLNKESKRPMKLPNSLPDLASPPLEMDLINPVKVDQFPQSPELEQEFQIRGSDIDWNMHVNNVCYLEWALEAIPAPLRLTHMLNELDISFLAEGKYGSAIAAQCFKVPDADQTRIHRIIEKTSNKTLATLRTKWAKK